MKTSENWDGQYWHIVRWHKSGRLSIRSDAQLRRAGKRRNYTVLGTATFKETLEPQLALLTNR